MDIDTIDRFERIKTNIEKLTKRQLETQSALDELKGKVDRYIDYCTAQAASDLKRKKQKKDKE